MSTSWINPNNGPRPGGMPPPAALAQSPQGQAPPSFASIFGGQSPYQPSVTAGINGQQTSFATPSAPNPNYVTPAAATALAKLFGANAVQQNRNGMASPGSPAPSQPLLGLDFGRGDVQGADVGVTGLQRGDDPSLIASRYQAGLNNTGWGGPAPAAGPMASDIFWDRQSPLSTNTPTPGQSAYFGAPSTQPAPMQQQPLNTTGSGTTAGLDAYRQLILQEILGGQR